MRSRLKFTVKCLFENKLRFMLTIMSISVGVISILIVNSVSAFGVSAVSSELESLGMNGLIVTANREDVPLGDEQLEIIENTEGIEKAAPATVSTSKIYQSTCDEDTSAMIWGIDEKAPDVISFELMYGRFIDKGDIKSHNKVCIVDEALAKQLFGKENVVGKNVNLLCNSSIEEFTVVGVVKTGRNIMQSLMGSYFPAFLYVPYTTFDNNPSYNQIFLKTNGSRSPESIAAALNQNLNPLKEDYAVTDLASQKNVLDSMLNTVTLILTVIGAISLLVSSISIMNIMLISVNERTKEIGIKKSIGASSFDISLDFLAESVIIAATGAVSGVVLSYIIIKIASVILKISITVQITTIISTIVISMLLGVIFGIFPAYKASKFKPVEALRR